MPLSNPYVTMRIRFNVLPRRTFFWCRRPSEDGRSPEVSPQSGLTVILCDKRNTGDAIGEVGYTTSYLVAKFLPGGRSFFSSARRHTAPPQMSALPWRIATSMLPAVGPLVLGTTQQIVPPLVPNLLCSLVVLIHDGLRRRLNSYSLTNWMSHSLGNRLGAMA
jgi:hypothetical protein